MSLEQDLKSDPPCHSRACAIQSCLGRYNYDENKCQAQIDALYECCKAFYDRQGYEAHTVSCPKPDLLKLKIEQRQESTKGS